MAATILIAGYVLGADFKVFRKKFGARLAATGIPFVTWSNAIDPCYGGGLDNLKAMIQYGRTASGEKVEVVLIMRGVEVAEAFRLARRDAAQAIFIASASEAMLEEHGSGAESKGYVLIHGHVPSLGQFRTAALICRRDFDADALIGEVFPPMETTVAHQEFAPMETPPPVAVETSPYYG